MTNTLDQESLANPEIPRTLFEVMQEHICNMLAHYMYFIAPKAGMPNTGEWMKKLENLGGIQNLCREIVSYLVKDHSVSTSNSQAGICI
jgi:hypothetical protein